MSVVTAEARTRPHGRLQQLHGQPRVQHGHGAALLLALHLVLAVLDPDTIGGGGPAVRTAVSLVALLAFSVPLMVLAAFSRPTRAGLVRGPMALVSVWLLLGLASSAWSFTPTQGVLQAVAVASLWTTSAWYVWTRGWDRFTRVLCVILVCVLAAGLLRDVLLLATGSLTAYEGRFAGFSYGPTNLARVGLVALVVGCKQLLRVPGRFDLLGAATVASAVLVLIGSQTRATALIAAVAVLVVLWHHAGPRRTALLAVGVGSSLLLLAPLVLEVLAGSRIGDGTEGDLNGRTTIWPLALRLLQQRPVLGWGSGSHFDLWATALRDGEIDWLASNAHNVLLDVAVSHGLVGAVLLVAALLWFFVRRPAGEDLYVTLLVAVVLASGILEALLHRADIASIALAGALAHRVASPPAGRHSVAERRSVAGRG